MCLASKWYQRGELGRSSKGVKIAWGWELTSACLRKLSETQGRVGRWHWLKGDIRVPLSISLLLNADTLTVESAPDALLLTNTKHPRVNGRDLGIVTTNFPLIIQQRVDMESGGLGCASQLSQLQDKLFLQVIGEIILGPEENNTSL